MTKVADKPETKTREIGERVNLLLNFEPEKTRDLGDGALEAIITTSSKDRYNESITTSGIKTDNYMNNPVVLYGHDYYGLPIGKTTKMTQMKNKIKAQFQLAIDEYPFAATVYAMVKAGYINAVSIGGRVLQWSEDYMTIEEMEMVEFSIVAVPANPEALITGRDFEKAVGKSFDTVREEFEDFNQKLMLDKLKGLDNNEVEEAIKVLRTLIDRLESTAKDRSLPPEPNKRKVYVLKDAKAVQTQAQKVIKIVSFKEREHE